MVCRLLGVGKTTFVREPAQWIKSVVLSKDKIRKEPIPRPKYNWKERKLIYDLLILLAKHLTNAGVNYILDATRIDRNSDFG